MQPSYALFYDIDGTLVSFESHQIPPSTILALTQAKANGHKVFIATGRPPIIITNLGAIEHLIDGYAKFGVLPIFGIAHIERIVIDDIASTLNTFFLFNSPRFSIISIPIVISINMINIEKRFGTMV